MGRGAETSTIGQEEFTLGRGDIKIPKSDWGEQSLSSVGTVRSFFLDFWRINGRHLSSQGYSAQLVIPPESEKQMVFMRSDLKWIHGIGNSSGPSEHHHLYVPPSIVSEGFSVFLGLHNFKSTNGRIEYVEFHDRPVEPEASIEQVMGEVTELLS